jgi:hypothetical protein
MVSKTISVGERAKRAVPPQTQTSNRPKRRQLATVDDGLRREARQIITSKGTVTGRFSKPIGAAFGVGYMPYFQQNLQGT